MDDVGIKGAVEVIEPTRTERTIARRSAEARATVPDLELGVDVDMSACVSLAGGTGSFDAMLVRACALALREHPRANGAYRDGRFELYSRVNVGLVLVAADEQVIATVFDADQKGLAELAAEIESLQRRPGALAPRERSGATFTLANLGVYGVTRATAIIPGPHAAALAAGELRQAAVVRDRAIVPGYVMALTLACDHRILYGARAAAFLARVRQLLERAEL